MLQRLALLALLLGTRMAWAQEGTAITPEEIARGPSPVRITALVDRAAAQGWGSVVPALRTAARQAYETNSGYVPAWYYLYRWADLLATPYNKALSDWAGAVEKAGGAHPNMPSSYAYRPGALSAQLSREAQLALLGNAALSEEFFTLLAPLDCPWEVLAILQKIYQQDQGIVADYR